MNERPTLERFEASLDPAFIGRQARPTRTLLEVRDLVVDFRTGERSLRAVDGVSFEVAKGGSLGIVGESGSGKSMTARAIMGLLPPTTVQSGQVLFDSVDLGASSSSVRRELRGVGMAMIFQDPLSYLNPVLTIGSQIAETFHFHRGLSWRESHEEAIGVMDRVGIPAARRRAKDYPHQFSGGMRQRAMIAMAIALNPKLLIADEPTTALDVTVQAQILTLLNQLMDEEDMALLVISHDLAVVAEVADHVAVMYAGEIVENGSVYEVFRDPGHPYTHALLESTPRIDQVGRAAVSLPGSPPVLTAIPPGCRFAPRCPHAQSICRMTAPELIAGISGSASACHFERASGWTTQR